MTSTSNKSNGSSPEADQLATQVIAMKTKLKTKLETIIRSKHEDLFSRHYHHDTDKTILVLKFLTKLAQWCLENKSRSALKICDTILATDFSRLTGKDPTLGDLSEELHRLYRINIRYHRLLLTKHSDKFRLMRGSPKDKLPPSILPSDMRALDKDLYRHSRALREYKTFLELEESEYLEDFLIRMTASMSDPFKAQSSKGPETHVSESDNTPLHTDLEEIQILRMFNEAARMFEDVMSENRGGLERNSEYLAFMSRLTMALFGGFSLILPMLIIYLHPTKLTNLLTTSVSVTMVAVFFAALTDWEAKDIIGATAAYAAVLVVFVGSSNTSDSLHNGAIAGIVVGVILFLYFLALGVTFIFAGGNIHQKTMATVGAWLRTRMSWDSMSGIKKLEAELAAQLHDRELHVG